MRMPIERQSIKGEKSQKMKTTAKKKKMSAKDLDDSISETISFVIKAHLTPLKSAALSKKANVAKKNVRVVAKKKGVATVRRARVAKKVTQNQTVKLPKTVAAKIAKKVMVKAKQKTAQAKKMPTVRRAKKKLVEVVPTSVVSQEAQEVDADKALVGKVKGEVAPLKKSPKEKRNVVRTKLNVPKNVKAAITRRKSPIKSELEEVSKEIKSELIVKKNKKPDESTIKPILGNSKAKPKVTPIRRRKTSVAVPKKPKKVVKAITKNILKNKLIKQEIKLLKIIPGKKVQVVKKRKVKQEEGVDSSTSDEIPLGELRQTNSDDEAKKSPTHKLPCKSEPQEGAIKKNQKQPKPTTSRKKAKPTVTKPKMLLVRKSVLSADRNKNKRKEDPRARKMKLLSYWNSPKRHRVASLNALAKVHCLYENETRGAIIDSEMARAASGCVDKKAKLKQEIKEEDEEEVVSTRILRSAPGLRGVGKHWDMHEEGFSSSEDNESVAESAPESVEVKPKEEKKEVDEKPIKKRPYTKRKRNRCELIMDLKDMVVRKRMASLNASAILAASYSVEKRTPKSPKSDTTESDDSDVSYEGNLGSKKCAEEDVVKKEEDRKVIEVSASPNKKVSVILNQDTDVTITGVYVNSTTRSTHHEGFCSIAGMQYRISAKSHTQTASTTVATETLMQSAANIGQENPPAESTVQPCKSYTPLSALSSMQPPGAHGQHGVPIASPPHLSTQHVIPLSATQHTSPIHRRHGCTSAFSAPPGVYGPPPAHHHPVSPTDPAYIHGYYQPAGPLITVPPHAHPQSLLGKPDPLSEVSSSPTPPLSHQPRSQSSNADSLDSDVIITSTTSAKESLQHQPPPPQAYRYAQYPPHSYPYAYHPQYYPAPPPAPSYHHELCYPPNPYLHHKPYPPPTYRRHLTAPVGTPYYQANPPDVYHPPPSLQNQPNQQVVTANPTVSSSSYQPTPSAPPPPIMESYPPPPPPPTLVEPYPAHYYSGYGPAPPPSCYTHSTPTRSLPYINAAYQSCPCPMQSCPKNVHTGPLTGDSKRSSHISSISKNSLPLPPVALALPLEPVSATGPPSPARGSAGMPPPPSPAGATYQPPPPMSKEEIMEPSDDCKPEKRRKARIGKSMVRNNIAANFPENTMLLMCQSPQHGVCVTNVKREIESPEAQKQGENALKSKVENLETSVETSKEVCKVNHLKVQSEFCLKTEEKASEGVDVKVVEGEEGKEGLLPCQKTVGENVKVKNMKRKLSVTKETENSESADGGCPEKKAKVEKCPGSYKDLIKKNVPGFKINNGKRKLNISSIKGLLLNRVTKLKFRRNAVRRKLGTAKEALLGKRMKLSKPLTASNLHNSKQNLKTCKGKCTVTSSTEQSENKEPSTKIIKKSKVNSKCSLSNNKKLGPTILDNLIAKNNVDKTIEYVVSSCCESIRTNKKLEQLEKCKYSKNGNKREHTNKSTNCKLSESKPKIIVPKRVGASKRKSKSKSVETVNAVVTKVPRKSLQIPKWSNGWTWTGEPFQAKVFLNSDETTIVRKCYPAMIHSEGDVIEPKDCVLLKAGPRKNDLPFVAKVAALWENPEDGEMMMSLLWFYRPEHTEQGRQPTDEPDEVFASRHKDTNSVACIEDKCYVLTFSEYCRYRAALRRMEEGIEYVNNCIPNPEPYPRLNRQPPTKVQTSADLVFFCRRVYDFRQKRIAKNPS